MALVGNISGSKQSNSIIGVSGSVIIANRDNALFPSFPGLDTSFFVSGSIGDSDKSVFGGDVVVSGSITSKNGMFIEASDLEITGALRVTGGISGSLTQLTDGTSYLIAGTGITITSQSNGPVTISAVPSAPVAQYWSETGLDNILTTGSVTISGDLTVNGTTTSINTVNLDVNDAVIGLGFSSGTIALANGDRGFIAGLGSSPVNAVFKWDNTATEFAVGRTTANSTSGLPIPLSSYANLHTRNIQAEIVTASLGFSGSLTTLVDGTSYLIASGAATITSGANGSVTIFAPAGTSIASAGDNRLLTSDGTSTGIVAESNFSFDGSLLALTGSMEPGADMTYNLGSPDKRWNNVYTGDLHLRNERGNWTVIEEEEYLSIRNNNTGKLYRFVLEPVETK